MSSGRDAPGLVERLFHVRASGSTPRAECAGGLTTFLTLSYILFVQPAVMVAAGVPAHTALFATCVASSCATLLMALLANYPIALAPAMGHNFFVAFTVCGSVAAGGFGLTWQQGLAAVLVSGMLFLLLSAFRFREAVIRAIPQPLQHAIAAGIGLLIALIGLQWGGLIQASPATLVRLGDLGAPSALLTLGGLLLTAVLVARRVPGALLIGLGASLAAGLVTGMVRTPAGIVDFDVLARPVLLELDFAGLFRSEHFGVIVFTLFFLDLFDTVGTLVGVGARAGLLKDGVLPRAGRALFADASGTVIGAALGTSTVTSYIESAAGVAAGARTGLASVVTAALFLLALPLHPLIAVVGEGVDAGGVTLHPVLAPTLIVVGSMMAKSLVRIETDDATLALPCFLAVLVIPLGFSISDGIGAAFIAASLLALACGRARERHPLVHVLAAAFVLRHVLAHAPS